ncbi:cell wall degradation protein [Marinobacterium nitratireducens]|uniref:Cell wall degradation protein n=1 Tax=Marinobacterium nitratireducens TaxID=518897 RepID=A0A918DNP2_9GAMM|nr:L,D-transpeptidase family protein [Marinobacterium nitratireducens]GGO75754.1 cell wall degradation protein [Marinobacterium nitratireducens]
MRYLIRSCLCLLLLLPVTTSARAQFADDSGTEPAATRFASYDEALTFYRQLAETYSWPALMPSGVLRPGDQDPVIAEIRQRLVLLGDLPFVDPQAQANPFYFDEALRQALVAFQTRHGLAPDGVWGPRTREALEVSPLARYRQLKLNLERQEQFAQQRAAQGRYVQINIPAYEMRYFEQGQEVLRMRAIVGKLKAKTPLVASEIRTLELNPDWNVPSGIAYRDIVPDIQASADYLDHSELQLVEGYGGSMRVLAPWQLDYSRLYRGPAPQQRFWQAPGPQNPLGQLKFNFPNDYQVYMHGTPSHSLFGRPVRNFSSGCIRIEYPETLARRLFGDAGLTPEGTWRFEDIIASGKNRVLRLPQPVAVYTTYWTAWLDENRQLQFRGDVYGLDREALAAQRSAGDLAGP